MPRGVEGLVSLRGNVIPVLSLVRIFLEHKDEPIERGKTMMVAEYSKRTLGFLVHEVDRIIRVDWERCGRRKPCSGFNQGPDYRCDRAGRTDTWYPSSTSSRYLPMPLAKRSLSIWHRRGSRAEDVSVFFVDDSIVARRKISEVLDKLGVKHKHATNGSEAWSACRRSRRMLRQTGVPVRNEIRVMLVDAEMPEMDGYVLTKNLKSDTRFNGIPVIMHSSLSSEANKAMGKAVGVDGYVAKFDAECWRTPCVRCWKDKNPGA
jgi:two-component system chemotaxis response regulator CheV